MGSHEAKTCEQGQGTYVDVNGKSTINGQAPSG